MPKRERESLRDSFKTLDKAVGEKKGTAPNPFTKEGRDAYEKTLKEKGIMSRKEGKRLRDQGAPDQQYYGGSKEKFDELTKSAERDVKRGKVAEATELNELKKERQNTREDEDVASRERDLDSATRRQSRFDYANKIGNIRSDAEGTIQQRMSELAGKPTIGQATEAAMLANRQNAQEQLAQQVGLMNRQARGMAGSMGEGGALAMQQGMASAGAGAADLAAMNQNQLNTLGANMRFSAAQQQRAEDVDTANLGMQTRLGAISDELNARQGLLASDQQQAALAGQRQLQLLGARNQMAGGIYGIESSKLADARDRQDYMYGTQLQQDQQAAAQRFDLAKRKNTAQRLLSTFFDPLDIRGSGSQGIVSSPSLGTGGGAYG